MTATRQHLARLLKYYPRQPCAPSLIKSRFFFRILQIYVQDLLSYILKFLVGIHAGNPRVPPRVLASGPKPCGGNNVTVIFIFMGDSLFITQEKKRKKLANTNKSQEITHTNEN